ncbi:MAG: helix-turn-helix transcriptional regulator [Clostridia bacterium]|nr:helix-turn-helix transcriptional regulator [Clostridia bacterium]
MPHIGIKIKELRKKKDMTQEKLAEYLNVSFQAVSKWETGAASPDLSMIVPLARLLDVTTDELFGIVGEVDEHQEELLKIWQETWNTGDTEKRYEIAKVAVLEYPGNFEYLMLLADAEASYAIHNCERHSSEQKEHFQNAVKYYEMIIEDCADNDIKNDAIYGIVMNLPNIGRKEDAIPYAKQHPKSDELLMWCLAGDEREKCRQKLIHGCMDKLVGWLEWGKHDLPSIKAAESIVKTIISDGNYLYHNDTLMHNKIWQAMCLTREKKFDEAIFALKESYEFAIAYVGILENAKKKAISYTSPVLNKLEFDGNDISVSGTTTLVEDFKEYLTWKEFTDLREREDFQLLFNL